MKHNYIKSMLTALLLLCSSIASAQIEVDGIYYVVSETDKSLSVTTSSTKYSGDIVIPESISLSSVTFPERSTGEIIAYQGASVVYNFYAEAGSTVSFKPYFGKYVNGKTSLSVYINNEEVFDTTASYGGIPEQTLSIESSGPQTLKFSVYASQGYASFTAKDVTLNLDKETEYSITAVGKEAFEGLPVVSIVINGRFVQIVLDGKNDEMREKLEALSPAVIDEMPIDFEEAFINDVMKGEMTV